MRVKNFLIFFLFLFPIYYSKSASRIKESPYPVSSIPNTIFIIDEGKCGGFTAEQNIALESLQGIIGQIQPQIYRISSNFPSSSKWIDYIKLNNFANVDTSYSDDFIGLFKKFKENVKGYILYDEDNSNVNVAFSVAGHLGGIAVSRRLVNLMRALNIPLLFDVEDKDLGWFFEKFKRHMNHDCLCFQDPKKASFLNDFAVFGKMISMWSEDIHDHLYEDVLSSMNPNSCLVGWGTDEFSLVSTASRKNIFVNAADFAINLSVLSNFEVSRLIQKTHSPVGSITGVHTVTFVFTDGDNIQWLLNNFSTDEKWYGSSERGTLDIGWTISPAMCELAPTVMDQFYQNASNTQKGRDVFISGPSGVGYIYPDFLENVQKNAELTNSFMNKSDLHILNIIGSNFSIETLSPYLSQSNVDALVFYGFSDYSSLKGQIFWKNNKPLIGGRFNFWDGFENVTSLADKLNQLPTDITSVNSYSWIPVHAWSRTVNDVIACSKLLNPNVRIVAPDHFVQLLKTNVVH